MAKPWSNLEEAIQVLTAQRGKLDAQIQALMAPVQSNNHAMVLEYIAHRDAKAAVEWGKAHQLKSPRGTVLGSGDITALIRSKHPDVPKELNDLALEILDPKPPSAWYSKE